MRVDIRSINDLKLIKTGNEYSDRNVMLSYDFLEYFTTF